MKWRRRWQKPPLSRAGERMVTAVHIWCGAAIGYAHARGHNPVLAFLLALAVGALVARIWRRKWLFGGDWTRDAK